MKFISKKYYGLEEAVNILKKFDIDATPYDIAIFALENSFRVLTHLNHRDVYSCKIAHDENGKIVNIIGRCILNAYLKCDNILEVIPITLSYGKYELPDAHIFYKEEIIDESTIGCWTIDSREFEYFDVNKLRDIFKPEELLPETKIDCYQLLPTNHRLNQAFTINNFVVTKDCLDKLLHDNSMANKNIAGDKNDKSIAELAQKKQKEDENRRSNAHKGGQVMKKKKDIWFIPALEKYNAKFSDEKIINSSLSLSDKAEIIRKELIKEGLKNVPSKKYIAQQLNKVIPSS